jgi:phosphosulfolactate synthase
MNFPLKQIPARDQKPRQKGLTMAMDKGMSIRESEDFLSVASEYVDIVKFGWGTSSITPKLKEKIAVYESAGIPVYFGGTLLEAFYVRGQIDDYLKVLEKYGLRYLEVSSGSVDIPEEEKCALITRFSQYFTVLSEVGSKSEDKILAPYMWVEQMRNELNAGAWKVIAEARESGTVGMFRAGGEVRSDLVEEILHDVESGRIIWEAPLKSQQAWFIKLLGSDVNLGNIAPQEVIPVETLRLGLRGDTFSTFLDKA